ncbi:TPA: hypothetical protein KD864_001923 [Vibrio parahaemolyticus]|nr:hypothetical protein [Vibrio parahaemolyticus]
MALYIDNQEILNLNLDGKRIETVTIDGVTVARKPTITTQPSGGTITDTSSKTLTVVADGLGSTMTYQWYKSDGTAISEAMGTSYTFTPSAIGSFGFYCRVTGFGGYTQTETVTIVVESAVVAPVITMNPSSGTITEAQDYTTSITVDWGGETGTIVWFLDDVAQPSSNSTSYTFVNPGIGSHAIRAEATNSKGTDVSSNATLTVNKVVSILTVGDKGTSKPTIRGYQVNLFGSLTNQDYAIRPLEGKLFYIVARDGLIDGASGAHILDISFSADKDTYKNFVVNLGGLTLDLTYSEDTWHVSNEVDDDGNYSYTGLLLDPLVVGDVRTFWNQIWNGVGNDYEVEITLS